MEKRALIVLNGSPCSPDLAEELAKNVSYTVCADGGYSWFSDFLLPVDIIVGDLDSNESIVPDDIKIFEDQNQDLTDFEKTLKHLINKNFNVFYVIGATGKEQDHFLSNLVITSKYSSVAKITLLDDLHRIWFVQEKKHSFQTISKHKPVISIFGWPSASFEESRGLAYPLDGLTLDHQVSGSRNIAITDRIEITLKNGSYFIFANDHPHRILNNGLLK